MPPARRQRDTLLVPGEGLVDVKRTRRSGTACSRAESLIAKRDDWVDRALGRHSGLYVSTGFMLSEGLQMIGDTAAASRVIAESRKVALAVRLDDLLAQLTEQRQPPPAQNPLLTPTDSPKGTPLQR